MIRNPKITYDAYGLEEFYRVVNPALCICGDVDALFKTIRDMDLVINCADDYFYVMLGEFCRRLREERKARAKNGL